jgi:hypothetical protein
MTTKAFMGYTVTGNHLMGYAVVDSHGAIEYDLLETHAEAEEICEALNLGIGPDWDVLEKYFIEGE